MILTGGKRFYDSELTEWQQVQGGGVRDSPSELGRILTLVSARVTGPELMLFQFVYFRQATRLTIEHSWFRGRTELRLPEGAENWRSIWMPIYAKALALVVSRPGVMVYRVRGYPQKDDHYGYALTKCARQSRQEAVECVQQGLARIRPSSPVPSWFLGVKTPVYLIEEHSRYGVLYDAALAAAKDQFPNEALLAEMM